MMARAAVGKQGGNVDKGYATKWIKNPKHFISSIVMLKLPTSLPAKICFNSVMQVHIREVSIEWQWQPAWHQSDD